MRNVFWVWLVLAGVGCTGAPPHSAHESEQTPPTTIAGQVVSDQGHGLGGVTVALLDQATGQPIVSDGLRLNQALRGPDGRINPQKLYAWTVAITDSEGRFVFPEVAPGAYRLIAQS